MRFHDPSPGKRETLTSAQSRSPSPCRALVCLQDSGGDGRISPFLFHFVFSFQKLYLIRQDSRTCSTMRLDPLMEVLSFFGGVGEDETWGAGNSILSGITHLLSAGLYYEWHGFKIAAQHKRLLSKQEASNWLKPLLHVNNHMGQI